MAKQNEFSERIKLNQPTVLVTTGLNILFCLAVATLIKVSGSAQSWWQNVLISFGFGLPIQTLTMALHYFTKGVFPLLHGLLAVVLGLTIGAFWAQYVLFDVHSFSAINWHVLLQVLMSGIGFTTVALGLHYSYLRQTRIREKLLRAEVRQLQHSRELAQSELKALQAQIEPHFLFNSLASIQALIPIDPAKAEQMLQHLTFLLRAVLQRTRTEGATLAQELQLIKAYLDIQQIRLGSRLRYRIDAPDNSELNFDFPILLLQPLVENAVGHGIEPSLEGGEVVIDVQLQEGVCKIEVRDTGVGFGLDVRSGYGIGVENIRARLAHLHAKHANLTVERGASKGTVCLLEVPYDN